MKSALKTPLSLLPLALLLVVVGCSGDKVTVYEIPKESEPANESPQIERSSVDSGLAWSVPESWVEAGGSSMRLGSYGLANVSKGDFDVSVTRFPGDVGGLFSNVNRWRGQIGLDPMSSESELSQSVEDSQSSSGVPIKVVTLGELEGSDLLTFVAVVDHNGFSWFFKLTGSSARASDQKANFLSWVDSIQVS